LLDRTRKSSEISGSWRMRSNARLSCSTRVIHRAMLGLAQTSPRCRQSACLQNAAA
jgi:hypothetical protein